MNTNELIFKLLQKSKEAFILGLEVYNKPTIKFYQIRDNADMCYQYTRNVSAYNSYSEKALTLIYEEIKKDPENIIQNLKDALKKKS